MRYSIWFLLAAVVSLQRLAFAEGDNNEPSTTEIVSQEDEQKQTSASECR